jgi:tRNA A-37 threonylcarbamoyl transferase component Bud32
MSRDSARLDRRTVPSAGKSPPAPKSRPGRRALDLRAERLLAHGAESELMLASHSRSGDELEVLKALRKDKAGDAVAIGRFAREVELATQLRAPGILPSRKVRRASGVVVLVMPCVLGPDALTFLVECVRRGRVPSLRALLPPALQLGEALAAMHRGEARAPACSHGDVTAGNVLLSMTGRSHLIDFGSVRTVETFPHGPRQDLRQLGLLLAALRAGRLPGGTEPPRPEQLRATSAPPEEQAFDLLVSRCVHPPEAGGFTDVEQYANALHALLQPSMLEEAGPSLAEELRYLFGQPHRGRAFGTGPFRPPMLPMQLSWLPPVPTSAVTVQIPEGAADTPVPDQPTDQITQPMRRVDLELAQEAAEPTEPEVPEEAAETDIDMGQGEDGKRTETDMAPFEESGTIGGARGVPLWLVVALVGSGFLIAGAVFTGVALIFGWAG